MDAERRKPVLRLRRIREEDREPVRDLLFEHWGAPGVVSRGVLHQAHLYPGFIAWSSGRIAGLLTYKVTGDRCEIVTLNSFAEGKGVGTRLLRAAERRARSLGCREIWLITTNDNIRAIAFYLSRGMRLARVYPGAIARSRKLKPGIPRRGMQGLRCEDEILFVRPLGAVGLRPQ